LQCSQPSQVPLAYIQDGFPQQRGWSDGIEPGFQAEPTSARSTFPFPLKPQPWPEERRPAP
jgi:hypothetical protein